MPYKLYILVEGDDDRRFFARVVLPLLQSKYEAINLVKYSNDTVKTRKRLIRSFRALKAEYIYVTDINNKPCVTAKKEEVIRQIGRLVNEDNIIVVVKEIESWYLAGPDEDSLRKFKISVMTSTDNITKEQFNRLIPNNMSRIGFMHEILESYHLETARNRNRSFRYFLKKWCNCARTPLI